jgi:hypothetical protein
LLSKTLVTAAGILTAAVTTSCTAHAEPPKFPDLSSYAQANAGDYAITIDTPGISHKTTFFLTPDGIVCGINAGASAGCTGNDFPGVPPAAPTEGGTPRVNAISTSSPIHPSGDAIGENGMVRDQPIKTLPPFHSISLGGVICGVDDAGMTACKDPQGRGFILSPSWSGWLPHV